MNTESSPWWRSAVIYQVYIRSFKDGSGDGLGDIAGLRSKLSYLAELGVDAIWINPWYPSPMVDAGYDVIDYRAVEPRFGTVPEAEALVGQAHQLGLKVLLDIIPNHTSDQHPWFQEALASAPGTVARMRYHFRPGLGADGDEAPNDWESRFGGPAWTRTKDLDGQPGEWYLHLFAPGQPDLNWDRADVRADFEETLRFWFDRGVDGFRIDVAHALVKEPGLPDLGSRSYDTSDLGSTVADHPFFDRDEVHDIYRRWRALAESYPDPRVFVAEAWVPRPDRLVRYIRPDELNSAFNFDFLLSSWQASDLRRTIDDTLGSHARVGAPPTWVLSNHDVVRHVSRYARQQLGRGVRNLADIRHLPADLELGTRRARAAAMLMLALPGGAYIYQGEELGLPEVEDLPESALQDPRFEQTGGTDPGRDGCRVPIPWGGERPPYGFREDGVGATWLPQPLGWGRYSVEAESADPGSMLSLYRDALHIRHAQPALGDGSLVWRQSPEGSLSFLREPGFVCIVNLSAPAVELPPGAEVLLSSGPLDVGRAPQETAVWLAV